MLTLARTGRIDKLSHGLCLSDDYEAVKHRMARFMAAGFREICEQRKQDRGLRPACCVYRGSQRTRVNSLTSEL